MQPDREQSKKKLHALFRKSVWLLALLPVVAGLPRIQAESAATRAGQWEVELNHKKPHPQTGIIFNDQSPRPSRHDLSQSTYVGYQVCAGCHGALNSTRPDHTIIQEWESSTNAHANDGAALAGGALNVYARTVADGKPVNGTKTCATCHTTGAPTIDQDQVAQRNGYDPSVIWNDHLHNTRFLKVQCENCHGPGSQHVLSGGDSTFINRVPDARDSCWTCHVNTPNEKGSTLTAPATDALISLYTSSLGHTHAGGALIAGTGGYEYAGENYSEGHNFPHTKIADTCVTCHTPRQKRSPTLDHSSLAPKIEACRNCHTDARQVEDLESYRFMENRQNTIKQLLIQLGGATATGDPDFNANGGLLGHAADKKSIEYKRARWNYALVINDGSLGVHNFDYAVELLLTSISHAPAQAAN